MYQLETVENYLESWVAFRSPAEVRRLMTQMNSASQERNPEVQCRRAGTKRMDPH